MAGSPLTRTLSPNGPINAGVYCGGPLTRTISPPGQSLVSGSLAGAPLCRQLSPTLSYYAGGPLSRTLTPMGGYAAFLVTINDSGSLDPYNQMASFYSLYCSYDKTNKLKNYLLVIAYFAKVHALCDPDSGTLAIEGWLILAIHVLLHFEIIPNLHELTSSSGGFCANISHELNQVTNESTTEHSSSPTTSILTNGSGGYGAMGLGARTKIEDMSLIGLLEVFFRYLTEDFDILGSIITVRGKGEQLPKNQWKVDPPVMWRLCIEDPFEKSLDNASRPFDLAATLTRPGQIQLFKAIRRAAFGVNAIIIKDITDTDKFVRMLFHKEDLLALSRLSGYNGSAVITTPVYAPSLRRKSKVIFIWTSDRSLHASLEGGGLSQDSSKESTARHPNNTSHSSAVYGSSNSLDEIELVNEPHRRNAVSNPGTVQHRMSPVTLAPLPGGPAPPMPPPSYTPSSKSMLSIGFGDESIRLIDGDYEDSDSDEDILANNSRKKSLSNRGVYPPGNTPLYNNAPHSGSREYMSLPSAPPNTVSDSRYHSLSNNSIGNVGDVPAISPPRRPPPGSGAHIRMPNNGYNNGNNNFNIGSNNNFNNVPGMDSYQSPSDRMGAQGSFQNRGTKNLSRGLGGGEEAYHAPYPSPAMHEGLPSYNYDHGYLAMGHDLNPNPHYQEGGAKFRHDYANAFQMDPNPGSGYADPGNYDRNGYYAPSPNSRPWGNSPTPNQGYPGNSNLNDGFPGAPFDSNRVPPKYPMHTNNSSQLRGVSGGEGGRMLMDKGSSNNVFYSGSRQATNNPGVMGAPRPEFARRHTYGEELNAHENMFSKGGGGGGYQVNQAGDLYGSCQAGYSHSSSLHHEFMDTLHSHRDPALLRSAHMDSYGGPGHYSNQDPMRGKSQFAGYSTPEFNEKYGTAAPLSSQPLSLRGSSPSLSRSLSESYGLTHGSNVGHMQSTSAGGSMDSFGHGFKDMNSYLLSNSGNQSSVSAYIRHEEPSLPSIIDRLGSEGFPFNNSLNRPRSVGAGISETNSFPPGPNGSGGGDQLHSNDGSFRRMNSRDREGRVGDGLGLGSYSNIPTSSVRENSITTNLQLDGLQFLSDYEARGSYHSARPHNTPYQSLASANANINSLYMSSPNTNVLVDGIGLPSPVIAMDHGYRSPLYASHHDPALSRERERGRDFGAMGGMGVPGSMNMSSYRDQADRDRDRDDVNHSDSSHESLNNWLSNTAMSAVAMLPQATFLPDDKFFES